MTGRHRHF